MTLKTITLELARNAEFPEGSSDRGYEFRAPLDADGLLDQSSWKTDGDHCTVRRFWSGEPDEVGMLRHRRDGSWVFHYDGMDEDDDEPIFKLDRHHFIEGEYVSITEHDGVQRTFRVASIQ